MLTQAFSGRLGRAIVTDYVRAASGADAPVPAPYPVQRGLTAAMREAAQHAGEVQRMQLWAALAPAELAGDVVRPLWEEAQTLLP